MILTKDNIGNDHLRIYANLQGKHLGDEIRNVDYIFFIDEEEEIFYKETGLRDMPHLFSKWLIKKYERFY